MKALAMVGLLVLCGCASVNTALKYDFETHYVAMPDDTYRVFEHPNRDRVMTTPSLNKTVGQGMIKGATFGIADVQTPEQLHESAARKYLDETGRAECKIVRGYLLMVPQYEFFFECPG